MSTTVLTVFLKATKAPLIPEVTSSTAEPVVPNIAPRVLKAILRAPPTIIPIESTIANKPSKVFLSFSAVSSLMISFSEKE